MSHSRPRSRIPVRPNTVSSISKVDEKPEEVEIQFSNDQNLAESVTEINDAFATGDQKIEIPEKLPLFKQSMINSSLVDVSRPLVPPKKYIPNYQKELNRPKKRISLSDELKTCSYDEPFPECGLVEQIKNDLKQQLEELNNDSEAPTPVETKIDPLDDLETRVSFMEAKMENLIELLHDAKIIKKPDFQIKIEEYKLEKLNSQLKEHSSDSDPTLHEEIMLEQRQKRINLGLGSEESLKFNKIPMLEKTGMTFETPANRKYMNIFKQIGKFNRPNE